MHTKVKKWTTGVADEVWKIHISSRDARRTEEVVEHIYHVIDPNSKHVTLEKKFEALSKFTLEEILNGLRDHYQSSLQSIANGLKKRTSL